jgi:putative FmdB family regulatory protein
MPIYEYEHVSKRGKSCSERFEVLQTPSEQAYTKCPECGHPVKKLISRPLKPIMGKKHVLSDKNIAKGGFTKYVKSSEGTYEKAAGPDEAPDTLDKAVMQENLDKLGD